MALPAMGLAAGLGLGAAVAVAGEPVLARVLSIGSDAVELEVQGGTGDRLRVPLSGSDNAGSLIPGGLVRVWPGSADAASTGAQGGVARASAGTWLEPIGPDRDRTGVRSRLGRGSALGRSGSRGSGSGGGRGGR